MLDMTAWDFEEGFCAYLLQVLKPHVVILLGFYAPGIKNPDIMFCMCAWNIFYHCYGGDGMCGGVKSVQSRLGLALFRHLKTARNNLTLCLLGHFSCFFVLC